MRGLRSTKRAMPAMPNISGSKRPQASGIRDQAAVAVGIVALLILGFSAGLEAHGVSGKDAVFLQGLQGQAIGPLLYLGAKHMVTGYDHLLFLVGVIFFLYRLRDVLLVRQLVHDRAQHDAAARRSRRHSRESLLD